MSITLIIIIITCLISYQCFQDAELFNKLKHFPYAVKHNKEYYRFVSSGFVHGSWMHLGINMFVLYGFGNYVENAYTQLFGELKGRIFYLLLYLLGIVMSDLFTYYKRQDSPYYASIGASGAVSAVLFSYILFEPWSMLMLYGIIPIPAIIGGVAYLIYSSYASDRVSDNINHDAHFWGAVFGFLFTIALQPNLIFYFWEKLQQLPF